MYYERDDEVYERIKYYKSVAILSKKGVKVDPTSPIVKICRLKTINQNYTKKLGGLYLQQPLSYGTGTPWDEIYTNYIQTH